MNDKMKDFGVFTLRESARGHNCLSNEIIIRINSVYDRRGIKKESKADCLSSVVIGYENSRM